ncbi:MAG: radical SAM protein, partial [Alphaproteobacteria bacterium]
MSRYKVAVNLELTSKCNAKCIMCPRDAIPVPALMTTETVDRVLDRITPGDVFRVVTAGYGEPTTHPKFIDYANKVGAHPVRFDMATNGERLDDEGKLAAIDGAFQVMILSFSS